MADAKQLVGVVLVLLHVAGLTWSQDEQDPLVWSEEDVNKFGIAQPKIEDIPLDIDLSSKIKFRYETNTGQKAFVLDAALNGSTLSLLRNYITIELGAWKFSLHEPYEGGEEIPSDNIPWVNSIDPIEFGNSIAGRLMQKAVIDAVGSKYIYHPYKVRAKIMRRGDFTRLHTDATKEDSEYSLMVFLNTKWNKNDYGELYLYDEDREIVAGAVPKYGRILLWQSSIPYLPRPPSIAFSGGQYLLHVQFTKSKGKVLKGQEEWQDAKSQRVAAVTGDFVGTGEPVPPPVDMKAQMVSQHQTLEGKNIYVFDDLYSKEDLDKLRAYILKYGTYYFDDSEDEESDNVQWIAGFNIDSYIRSRLWNITQRVASFVSGSDKWFPYDISCNLIRSADHTRIHTDCSEDEDEWTHMIYLNPDMTKNDYGETVFYERNSDNTEIAAEVKPKYGRTVIFQGIIPHSARPPSTNYTHARLSFVAKLSVNEVVGRTKAFMEEMRHFAGVQQQLQHIKDMETSGTSVRKPQKTKAKKYASAKEDDATQEENSDDEGQESEGPENEGPENEGAEGEAPNAQEPADDEREEEPESEDPEMILLDQKLKKAQENPKSTVEDIRSVHRELMSRHAVNREAARQGVAKFL